MRYRNQEGTKSPWRGEFSDWRTIHGIKVPHRAVAAWEHEPYGIFEIEGAEYNVDVSGKFLADGATRDAAQERRSAKVRPGHSGTEGG